MAVPASPGSIVGRSLGKYEILALLAVGGTAEIYLARIGGEAGFEKFVVVKCLHEHLAHDRDFVDMFLDEARLGAQLDHSNIVQTLELGQHQGRYYMVMEYLAGLSLAQVARAAQDRLPTGLIPPEIVLGLAAQACAGLHYAHERTSGGAPLNVVHRDVSPQNLVISFDGVLKVVDFGIAKADVRRTRTETGTIKGKFAYMSPEQCMAKPLDRRTDIFALGTIIHELLSGRRLFKRGSAYETYQAILSGKVPTPSSINPSLDKDVDALVMKALAYEREGRYPTAEAFGEALLGLLHKRGESVSASDVARFFDMHFEKEIEEHGQQMREVIAGRRVQAVTGAWGSGDTDSEASVKPAEGEPAPARPSPPARGRRRQTKDSAPTVALGGPKASPISPLGKGASGGDFEDGGETQIELYPMGRFAAMDADAATDADKDVEPEERGSDLPTDPSLPVHTRAPAAGPPAHAEPSALHKQRRSIPPPPPGAPQATPPRADPARAGAQRAASGPAPPAAVKKTMLGTAPPQPPPSHGSGAISAGPAANAGPPPPPPMSNAPAAHASRPPALGSSPPTEARALSASNGGMAIAAPAGAEIYPRAVAFQPDADHAPDRNTSMALLAIAFLISAGIALGATVLIGALFG